MGRSLYETHQKAFSYGINFLDNTIDSWLLRCQGKLINDIYVSSDKLNFYLFANDTNILFANKNLKSLEQIVTQELCNLHIYLAYSK